MHTNSKNIKRRREHGEGSIRFKKSKKMWEVRLTYGKREDGTPNRRSEYARTEPEAKKLRKQMIKERDALINPNSKSLLMNEYYEKWLRKKRNEIRQNSFLRIRQVVETYILPEIGFYQLCSVTYDDCAALIEKVIDKGLSLSTAKKVYEALNACFNWALEKRDILYSPMLGMAKPSLNSDNIPEPMEMMPFEEDEYVRFFEEAKRCYDTGTPVYRLGWLFIFMLACGIRIGEALALRWSDIDFTQNKVHIWQTMVLTEDEKENKRKRGEKVADRTKSRAGKRILNLNATALEALTELHKITGKFKYIASCKTGNIIKHRGILRTFHCILDKANLEKRGIHNTRHTFASHLFKRKVDIVVISKLLGHGSVETTRKIYIHLCEEQKREAIYAFDYLANEPNEVQPPILFA